MTLPTGAPRTACEQESFYELVPTMGLSSKLDGAVFYEHATVTYHSQLTRQGFGIYGPGLEEPSELQELTWLLGPELVEEHMARLEPTLSRHHTAQGVAWTGVGVLSVGGIVTVAGTASLPSPDMMIGGAITMGVGIVMAIVGYAMEPNALDLHLAMLRKQLLFEGEDDLPTAASSVAQYNAEVRAECESYE